jgi:hypothetical protein
VSTHPPEHGHGRSSVDPTVRAILLFAAAVMGLEIALLVSVQVWPAFGPVGQAAVATINAGYAATMTSIAAMALFRQSRR